jgi:hypothetical protein
MDVFCACGEPWEAYYLRHELIDSDNGEFFSQEVEDNLKQEGWIFYDHNILAILQCPCCKNKKDRKQYKAQEEMIKTASDLLKDDPDGFLSFMDDCKFIVDEN